VEYRKGEIMKSKKHGGYVIQIDFKGESVKDYRPDAFYNITGIAD